MSDYDALLLVSFGGPERKEDVLPFLENVTRGRGIPKERLLTVAEHYYHLGGKSPLNDQGRALLAALDASLRDKGIELPVAFGNRNWDPFLADTLRELRDKGARKILALTTSAFSSYSGCRQYREDLDRANEGLGLVIDKIRPYWNHPGFLETVVARTEDALAKIPGWRRETTRLVFTAHSIPNAMAATSAYANELHFASRFVAEAVGLPYELAYQSRSGPPSVPWLGPDILESLRALESPSDVVVVPIGFTSDHVEVIWDLDHDARAVADELGFAFHRAATVGTHPRFVEGLTSLVRERLEPGGARLSVLGSTPCPDRCPSDCCAYTPRRA